MDSNRCNQEREQCGDICTTWQQGNYVTITSSSPAPIPDQLPSNLLEVLVNWECTWMWKSLQLIGDDNWLEDSIAVGTCVAVTDGSYIRELYPKLCLAAFILECTEGWGIILGSFAEQSLAADAY